MLTLQTNPRVDTCTRRPFDAELRLPVHVAEPPAEQQAVFFDLQRVLAFAARSAFLDREHVGEVGGDL